MSKLEENIKQIIVEALMLEDVKPHEIDSEAPLFGEGLGLDSIDALELSMAIDKAYNVKINAEDENTQAIFRSVRALAEFVEKHQAANT